MTEQHTPGPWGANEHPADWAFRTGRISDKTLSSWKAQYAADPAGIAQTLASLGAFPWIAEENAKKLGLTPPALADAPQAATRNSGAPGYANLVEELRSNMPRTVAAAERHTSAPQLFAGSGNMPLATASGVETSLLGPLPWRARLVVAYEPDRQRAFELAQQYADHGGEEIWQDLDSNDAVRDYTARVNSWFRSAPHDDEDDLAADEAVNRLFNQTRSRR
ncbi:hypothetical protein Cme02nite_45110 [Catellatospora methionotrophica]|uniref:Uncharacterized protein n=1 Tax=Catellatospora methionotrophica TaxID=121620 RepID=A0A8J3LIF7_9ACTN|nr:hypothetical protein [Catellatospora methionotrophica]GIG16179.1 hypothetical protein Cme02nite_45110 [Catellatospora methionotrophica]